MPIIEIILLSILILSFLDQLFFYSSYYLLLKPDLNTEVKIYKDLNSLSVIIAARNESEKLKKFLPEVMEQNYPNFEVIVINDGSLDNTEEILLNYKNQYNNLKIINIDTSLGKKEALSIGIENSNNEYLIFTDADCFPASKNWLSLISRKLDNNKEMVLGYGAYKKTSGFVNGFICYDTYMIALQYFSAATIGRPYMGVGRNIAYTKKLWLRTNGFESHKHILSGDDDLFVSEASNSTNVAICIDPDAFTYSIPKKTISEFIKQKSRHLSTSSKYKFIDIILSGGELFSRFAFFISLIVLIFVSGFKMYLILILLFRIIFIYLIGYKLRKKFNNKIPILYYVLFDIFTLIFFMGVFINKLFIFNSKQW